MKHTAATKRKLSEMRAGEKNPFFGKRHSPETRLRLAANLRVYREGRQYDIRPQTVTIPTGTNLSYLAGIVDGEGSIGFSKGRPYVAAYNSSLPLMRWIKAQTGRGFNLSDKRGRVNGYAWRVSATNDVRALCAALLPHLIIKRKNAETILAFIGEKHG